MKKFVTTILFVCAILIGARTSLDSAFAETTNTFPVIAIPLTNNNVFAFTNLLGVANGFPGGFTNTLVRPTNLASLRLTNVVTLLLGLQTNIEEVLPVLAILTSNAAVAVSSGSSQFPAAVVPITSAPAGLFLPPTGQVTASNLPATIYLGLGTNILKIDPPTYQALVELENDLEQTLPVLQDLNGTAPRQTNPPVPLTPTMAPLTNLFSPVNNFGFAPLSTGFAPPLTNAPQIINSPSPF